MTLGPAPAEVFEKVAYRPFVPSVVRAEGSFLVSRGGIVLSPRWAKFTLYRHEWVALQALLIAVGSIVKRGAEKTDDSRPLAVVHSIWSRGYYHWLTESLPRALLCRDKFADAIPILPQDHFAAYAPTLHALGFDQVRWYPSKRNVWIERPVISECPPHFGTTDPEILRRIREVVVGRFGPPKGFLADKIVYVSRKKARGRRVRNEEDLLLVLKRYNAEVVCFEDLEFEQQVELLSRTKLLVSIHGAGLTNMMWMPPGGAVLELIPRRNGMFDWNVVRRSFLHDACYIRLAEAMGQHHHAMLCESHHGQLEESWNADITVDVPKFGALILDLQS